jgi:hypothetical protein
MTIVLKLAYRISDTKKEDISHLQTMWRRQSSEKGSRKGRHIKRQFYSIKFPLNVSLLIVLQNFMGTEFTGRLSLTKFFGKMFKISTSTFSEANPKVKW